jgi:short coiled-coil protein
MSFSGLSLEPPSWGVVSPPASDLVKDALRKEQLLKYVLRLVAVILTSSFNSHRDIAASQDDLRSPFDHILISLDADHLLRAIIALVDRVHSVQKEVDKLEAGNQTLQMYIDNLTVQMAKRR